MVTKKDKLIKELVDAGIQLSGEENEKDLQALKDELDEKVQGKEKPRNEGKGNKPKDTQDQAVKGGKIVYMWLKSRAFINDEERIEAGLYSIPKSQVPKRLKEAQSTVCEIFEGEIPSRTLVGIARFCGVNPDNYREDEELLEVLEKSELRPFTIHK